MEGEAAQFQEESPGKAKRRMRDAVCICRGAGACLISEHLLSVISLLRGGIINSHGNNHVGWAGGVGAGRPGRRGVDGALRGRGYHSSAANTSNDQRNAARFDQIYAKQSKDHLRYT